MARLLRLEAFVEEVLLDPAQLAKAAVDVASDKKASDIILLDIRDVAAFADYFVICSGNNPRQIQAIADIIDEELGKQGAKVLHREGVAETGWVLLDFGDVIVHILEPGNGNTTAWSASGMKQKRWFICNNSNN